MITQSNWPQISAAVIAEKGGWSSLYFISRLGITIVKIKDVFSFGNSILFNNYIILSIMVGVFIDAFFKASKMNAENAVKDSKV